MTAKAADLLAPAIGRHLETAIASIYYCNGELDSDVIDIWLGFDRLHQIQIRIAPNGDGLVLSQDPALPYRMGESGEVLIRELPESHPLALQRGKALTNFQITPDDEGKFPKSIKLIFESKNVVIITGDNDEIIVNNDHLP